MDRILKEKLITLAKEAQENSYTPYSKFPVGCALITTQGEFYHGCNVENISYGLTNCAERTTIFKMVSEKGPTIKIQALAVTSKSEIPCSPCGACRQVIQEFSIPQTLVIYKSSNDYLTVSIAQLLPGAFSDF